MLQMVAHELTPDAAQRRRQQKHGEDDEDGKHSDRDSFHNALRFRLSNEVIMPYALKTATTSGVLILLGLFTGCRAQEAPVPATSDSGLTSSGSLGQARSGSVIFDMSISITV